MGTSSPAVMSADATFSPVSSDVRVVIQQEGIVLLHVRDGMFYRANQVGARIWEKLITGIRLDEVIDQIAGEFHTPAETVGPDVVEFVNSLLSRGFVRAAERQ